MSSFTNIAEVAGTFSETELDTGVDFEDIVEVGGTFTSLELDEGVDFIPTGDAGSSIIVTTGFGDGGFGDGPFGGSSYAVINSGQTIWTNIETP